MSRSYAEYHVTTIAKDIKRNFVTVIKNRWQITPVFKTFRHLERYDLYKNESV